MAWRTDHPVDWMAWSLIIVRSTIAPMLTVYLSLSAPLPVGPKGILYQAEFASGRGVLRDVVMAANDQAVSLAHKMELFGATATMSPHERERLEQMIHIMQAHPARHVFGSTTATLHVANDESIGTNAHQVVAAGANDTGRTGEPKFRLSDAPSTLLSTSQEPMPGQAGDPQKKGRRLNVRTHTQSDDALTTTAFPRTNSGRSLHKTWDLRQRREIAAKQIMDSNPTIGPRDLARQISEFTHQPCGSSNARKPQDAACTCTRLMRGRSVASPPYQAPLASSHMCVSAESEWHGHDCRSSASLVECSERSRGQMGGMAERASATDSQIKDEQRAVPAHALVCAFEHMLVLPVA